MVDKKTAGAEQGQEVQGGGNRVLLVVEAQVGEAGDESLVGLLQPAHLPGELASAVQKSLLLAI